MLARSWQWAFRRPVYAWIALASVAVPPRVLHSLGCSREDGARYHAGILQLGALFLVVYGIQRTLKRFGKAGPIDRFMAWFKDAPIPWPRPKAITATMSASVGQFHVSARGRVMRGMVHGSLEDRVQAIVANLQSAFDEIDLTRGEADGNKTQLSARIDAESAERKDSVLGLWNLLTEHSTGGIDRLYLGTFWTIVSIVLRSISPASVESVYRALHLF